jgi:hypothetical protein
MKLDVGTPPQQVTKGIRMLKCETIIKLIDVQMLVLLDTGSSNFAVAAAAVESKKEYFHTDE